MIFGLLLFACLTPENGTHQQSSWTILGVNQDGSLIDARFTQGNSGMLAQSGHVRTDWVPTQDAPARHIRHETSGAIQEDSTHIQIGTDHIRSESSGWALTINSAAMNARIQLQNSLLKLPETQTTNWNVRSLFAGEMKGFIHMGEKNSLINGYAVGLHSSGKSPPGLRGQTRRQAFVLDKDIFIGIDQFGSNVTAFAMIGGQQLDTTPAALHKETRGYRMDFRPNLDLEILLDPRKPHLSSNPWDHLYAIEQLVASWRYKRPIHRVRAAEAEIRLGDRKLTANAVISVNTFR